MALLIHLPRGADGSNFNVSFDSRWRYAFVDSIASSDSLGLPDVESMIGRTMKEVIASLDLGLVLVRAFRMALSRLKYQYPRSNDDVRQQVSG